MKRIFLRGHILSTAGDAFSLMIDPCSVNDVLAQGGGEACAKYDPCKSS